MCAVGVALTLWVVATRRLLNERAALDRWVGDAVGALRATVDQAVATRVMAAERDWTTVLIEQGEAGDARVADQVRAVDGELREHAMAGARATATRDREVPDLQRALAAVRDEAASGRILNGRDEFATPTHRSVRTGSTQTCRPLCPAEPDGAPFDLDLPVVRVAAWEAVEAGPDPADGQVKPAAPDRRPLPGGVTGWHPGDEVTI